MPIAAKLAIDAMSTDEKVRTVRYIVSVLGSDYRYSPDDFDCTSEKEQLSACSRFCRENPERMSHEEVFFGLQEIVDAGRQVYT